MLVLEIGSSSENETKRAGVMLAEERTKGCSAEEGRPGSVETREPRQMLAQSLQRAMPAIGHRACATGCTTPPLHRGRSDDDTVSDLGIESGSIEQARRRAASTGKTDGAASMATPRRGTALGGGRGGTSTRRRGAEFGGCPVAAAGPPS